MASFLKPRAGTAALCILAIALASCGLPRSGPNKKEIFQSSVEKEGNAYIIRVNDGAIQATRQATEPGFPQSFINARKLSADTIQPGDELRITIYENVEDGLFGTAGAPSNINLLQVDQSGHIFMPYVGRIRASGNSPESLRRTITRKLDPQTPEPQVLVSRTAGDRSTVSINGSGGQGIFPIEASTLTLSGMIAVAGGVTTDPESTRVTVTRGAHKGTVWLESLYNDARQDIALRPGDRILIQEDKRRCTALGATGGQSLVDFPRPTLSAIEALSFMGGLSSALADPTGIFIFREEMPHPVNRMVGKQVVNKPTRVAYILNLKEPNGVFYARDFQVRDGDTIYVTEAPYVQWTKTLAVLTSSVGAAQSLSSAAGG